MQRDIPSNAPARDDQTRGTRGTTWSGASEPMAMPRPVGTAGGALDSPLDDGRGYGGPLQHRVLLGDLRRTLRIFPGRCRGTSHAWARLRGRDARKCEQHQGRHYEGGVGKQVAHGPHRAIRGLADRTRLWRS